MRLVMAIGLLSHMLLGTLCMASPIPAPIHVSDDHTEHHHESQEQAPSTDCAGHCFSGVRAVLMNHPVPLPAPSATFAFLKTTSVQTVALHNPDVRPTISPPVSSFSTQTTVLLC